VDPDRGGREVARLLAPAGTLAVVVPTLADTPFLAALRARLVRANPKARPRSPPVALLFSVAGLAAPAVEHFEDEAALDEGALAAVVRSLSYAGPALGPAALDALQGDVRALSARHGGGVWRRHIGLFWASRKNTQRPVRP
jgi:hypothetical protein